jgi:hypothetical protein
MAGYNAILELRRLEKAVDELGFMLSSPRAGSWGSDGDKVSLKPKDADSVPIYARDAEVFTGSLEQLQTWIRGVEWARSYDMMLRLSDDKKRTAAEAKELVRQADQRRRTEQKEMIKILSSSDQENRKAKKG